MPQPCIKILLLAILTFSPQVFIYAQTPPVIHQANTNPLGIHLARQVPREYTPGSMMEIVINIYCDAPDPNYPITAVGLYETLPPDWIFVSMRGITTEPPQIAPAQGTAGVLQFAWITPPTFPCSFAYTVQVPEDSAGVKTISGQVEYRTNGPRLVSPPEITQINGIDRTPPEITLLGDNPYVIYQGTEYREPGYKAQDNVDGNITDRVQVIGNVSINQPGEYTLTYSVRDNAGNNATATRIVRVLERETQKPTSGGTVTPPSSGGGIVVPPVIPSTRTAQPSKPTQTVETQQQTPTPNIPTQVPSQRQRPEEVTFPRPDVTAMATQKEGKPEGIASGKPLNPFEIPKEIRAGVKPPPNFERNKIPSEADLQKSARHKIATTGEKESKTTLSEGTSSASTENPANTESITTAQENKITEGEMKQTEVVATIANDENTEVLATAPIKMDTGSPETDALSFIGGVKEWWSQRSQAEQRNLIGMFILLGLLALLCLITGRTAYQGISPQPRKKLVETAQTEATSEK